MGNNTVFVEGRYSLGLADINDDSDPNADKVKTKGIQIMAGITFPSVARATSARDGSPSK